MPQDFWKYDTVWINIIENHSAVQFVHRWLAITSVVMILSLWCHGQILQRSFPALHGSAAMCLAQLGLGVGTLMSNVHIHVAVLHQAGAVMLFALLLTCINQTAQPKT